MIRAQSVLDSTIWQRAAYDDMPLRAGSPSMSNHASARGCVASSLPTLIHRCVPYVPAPPPPQRRRLPCLLEFLMCMINHEKYRDALRRSAPRGQFVNSVSQIDKVLSNDRKKSSVQISKSYPYFRANHCVLFEFLMKFYEHFYRRTVL